MTIAGRHVKQWKGLHENKKHCHGAAEVYLPQGCMTVWDILWVYVTFSSQRVGELQTIIHL